MKTGSVFIRCTGLHGPGWLRLFSLLSLTTFAAVSGAETDNPAKYLEDPEIRVIGVVPLPSKGSELDKYPGNVQTMNAEDLQDYGSLELTDALTRHLGSFNINSVQNNPYQNDLFYRGFLVSPLVGTANGLSVYLDGVRINEGFGGTLNWDLIPESALAEVDVVPGSNPVFGRNTLGGAVSMRTKSGLRYPGTRLELSGGSFSRQTVELEHGGSYGAMDWYLNFDSMDEDGWRQASPSDVQRAFLKFGWENDITDIDASFIYADNDLFGNGLAPEMLLQQQGRRAVHTQPDQTLNRVRFFTINTSHLLTDDLQLAGNFYRRKYTRTTVNGDAELECEAEDENNREYSVLPGPDGSPDGSITLAPSQEGEEEEEEEGAALHLARCNIDKLREANAYLLDPEMALDAAARDALAAELAGGDLEVARELGAELRGTNTDTDGLGGTLQISHDGSLFGRKNDLTLGLAYEQNDTRYTLRETAATLDANSPKSAIAVQLQSLAGVAPEVDVRTNEDSLGLYVHNSLDLTDQITLTLSGRYQNVSISIRDLRPEEEEEEEEGEATPLGNSPALEEDDEEEAAPLDGDHSFSRFNPAIGINYSPLPALTLFASYSEGFRTPTAAELTCADENAPCNLPNAFVADPPLDPVVARTYEFGGRGVLNNLRWLDSLQWHAALFRTDLSDDLLFIHTTNTGAGFFRNIGDTRRQGLELGVRGGTDKLDFFINYAYLQATIETDVTLSSAVRFEGTEIKSGSDLPGIPDHNIRMGLNYLLLPNWVISSTLRLVSSSVLRGDEGNTGIDNEAGQKLSGEVGGYGVWDIGTTLALTENLSLWARVENILDKEYVTTGAYNFNAVAELQREAGAPIDIERFVAPGPPRAGWVGVRIQFQP